MACLNTVVHVFTYVLITYGPIIGSSLNHVISGFVATEKYECCPSHSCMHTRTHAPSNMISSSWVGYFGACHGMHPIVHSYSLQDRISCVTIVMRKRINSIHSYKPFLVSNCQLLGGLVGGWRREVPSLWVKNLIFSFLSFSIYLYYNIVIFIGGNSADIIQPTHTLEHIRFNYSYIHQMMMLMMIWPSSLMTSSCRSYAMLHYYPNTMHCDCFNRIPRYATWFISFFTFCFSVSVFHFILNLVFVAVQWHIWLFSPWFNFVNVISLSSSLR